MNNPHHNPLNRLLTESDVVELLGRYGLAGVRPVNMGRYLEACVHRSFVSRNKATSSVALPIPLQPRSYDRCECVGDAVLGSIVATYLFHRFPNENEGFISTARSKIVNGQMLALLSERLGLTRFALLSRQAEQQGMRTNTRLAEDLLESWIGAIFLDLGYNCAQAWVVTILESYVDFGALILQM